MEENREERYIRHDVQGGFLYNKAEIDYYRETQAIDVMANLMLGDYNGKGNYVVNKGIVDELVKMKKIYQYSFGSTTFCQSASDCAGYGNIDFAVKMRKNTQNNTVTSTLQLLETIDRANGYYQNTNTAPIANYTAPESPSYIVDMLKYFNIVSKKDEGLLKQERNEDEDIELIIARMKYEAEMREGIMSSVDDLNELLYKKRLKLLAKSAVGKKILDDFGKEAYKINGWFVKEGMPGYYRYLNQVLDGLMETRSAEILQDVALKAALNKANEAFASQLANLTNHQNMNNVNQMNRSASAADLLKNQNNGNGNPEKKETTDNRKGTVLENTLDDNKRMENPKRQDNIQVNVNAYGNVYVGAKESTTEVKTNRVSEKDSTKVSEDDIANDYLNSIGFDSKKAEADVIKEDKAEKIIKDASFSLDNE